MRTVTFTVPGRVNGKGRHRARVQKTKDGKSYAQTYPDNATRSHEAMVRQIAADAMGANPLLQGPLSLEVQVTLNTPKSWSKKRKSYTRYATGKPDIDNVVKLLTDSCNGVLYRDDSEFAEARIIRRYDDTTPEAVYVSVCELFDGPPISAKVAA